MFCVVKAVNIVRTRCNGLVCFVRNYYNTIILFVYF